MLLEIPAGKIEKDETPSAGGSSRNGRRDWLPGTLRPLLKWYLAPGYSTELMHIFVATNLREITRGLLDDDENIEIKEMRLSADNREVYQWKY